MIIILFVRFTNWAKNPPADNSHITPQQRDLVRQLRRQGWGINEIASRLKRTPAEIELILELPNE